MHLCEAKYAIFLCESSLLRPSPTTYVHVHKTVLGRGVVHRYLCQAPLGLTDQHKNFNNVCKIHERSNFIKKIKYITTAVF